MNLIAICSSASVYEQVNQLADKLIERDFTPVVPHNARLMKQSGDYDITHYKTWFADAGDYGKKADLMRKHFDEIAKSDAILVANYEKHGQANYIGGNVLMEMAIAFYLHKPIYILNDIPESSSFEEEIKGFMPIVLRGDLTQLK